MLRHFAAWRGPFSSLFLASPLTFEAAACGNASAFASAAAHGALGWPGASAAYLGGRFGRRAPPLLGAMPRWGGRGCSGVGAASSGPRLRRGSYLLKVFCFGLVFGFCFGLVWFFVGYFFLSMCVLVCFLVYLSLRHEELLGLRSWSSAVER